MKFKVEIFIFVFNFLAGVVIPTKITCTNFCNKVIRVFSFFSIKGKFTKMKSPADKTFPLPTLLATE